MGNARARPLDPAAARNSTSFRPETLTTHPHPEKGTRCRRV